ncbi:hypothetical protein D6789_04050 [Candidatus Woesearchaeota archaeon]|nr:MAG: hypothetical protein D6789_04050 [Candidatus Woesearchaeota archaeon]
MNQCTRQDGNQHVRPPLSTAEKERVALFTRHPAIRERYRNPRIIGVGASSLVLRAEEPRAARSVVLRIPRPHGALKEKVLEEILERRDVFDRISEWVSSEGTLALPRVPTIYSIDTLEDIPYTVEQFIPGETLATRMRKGPLPLQSAARVFHDVAMTLRAMHEGLGIAHLDLHPGNIMVTPADEGYVLDIGLAKTFSKNGPDTHGDWLSSTGERHSVAPEMHEQLARYGKYAVTQKGEVYALGVNLYAMLTGQFPFDAQGMENGEARAAIRAQQTRVTKRFAGQRFRLLRTQVMHYRGLESLERVPELRGRSDLEDVVFTMLAHESVRYPSVRDALEDFTRALPLTRSHTDRLVPGAYTLVALVAAGAITGVLWMKPEVRQRAGFEGGRVVQRVQSYEQLSELRRDALAALRGEAESDYLAVPQDMDARIIPLIDAYRTAREAIAAERHVEARTVLEDAVQLDGLQDYEHGYALPVMLANELLLSDTPNLDRVLRLLDEGESLLARAPPARGLKAERTGLRASIAETRARIFFSRGFYEQALRHVNDALATRAAEDLFSLRADIYERLGRAEEAAADRARAQEP